MGLKRDSKGNLAEVNPLRSRKGSIYKKGTNETFKISRSKFSSFLECKRCFYLDRVKGLKDPGIPGWSLNIAVDDLLKKEFDFFRDKNKPHPVFKKHNLNFIPYQHEKLDYWRNSLRGGISYLDKDTNLEIHGGVDDIWYDLDSKKLVVVDYKAQSTNTAVETSAYLNSIYHQGYKIQMDIYVHILRKMGFEVSDTSYFYVCNAEKDFVKFDGKLNFTVTLVPYITDTSWVQKSIKDMKKTLELEQVPEINRSCEKCMYLLGGNSLIN